MPKKDTSTRVLISMQNGFLKDLDALADAESRSRSEMIREAVRFYKSSHYATPINK